MLHLTEDQSLKATKYETYCEMLFTKSTAVFPPVFPQLGINLDLETAESGFNLV